jgi:succinyl-diaminopimelate desuccinylase
MSRLEDVLKLIDGERDAMVHFMLEMLKLKAVSPDAGGKGEYERAVFVERWLEELGAKVSRYEFPDKRVPEGVRVNLTTSLEGKNARTLWFATHLDTVPEGSRELWETDPYNPVVKDGKIFGRGSEDNGQGVVSTLFTYKALKTLDIKPVMNVGFAYVSDEETGSKFGVVPLFEAGAFKPIDMAIVPDYGSPDGSQIEVAEKDSLWLKITTKGKQVHGSQPQKGLNAARVGMKFALEIDELLHRKYSASESLFDPPISTFEPTKRELNVDNVNTVPGLDVQYFDCRILPQYQRHQVMNDIQLLKEKVQSETGAQIKLDPPSIPNEEPIPLTPVESEVVQRLQNALKNLRGIEGKPIGIGGGTFGSYFRFKGIHSAVWSTLDDMAHQPNEYCWIDNIANDAKVFAHTILT